MYNRERVYEYAKEWAFARNPAYYNYDAIGGDCTNFVSQCMHAGGLQMNYNVRNGWYYIDGNNKSPSWTGVEFLYNFLTSNEGVGPKGIETEIDKLEVGDIIQLSFDGVKFAHTPIVVQSGNNLSNTLVAAHSYNAFGKQLSSYNFQKYRCIHISL